MAPNYHDRDGHKFPQDPHVKKKLLITRQNKCMGVACKFWEARLKK